MLDNTSFKHVTFYEHFIARTEEERVEYMNLRTDTLTQKVRPIYRYKLLAT